MEMLVLLSDVPWFLQALMTIFFLPLSDSITAVLYRLLVVRSCSARFGADVCLYACSYSISPDKIQ